MQIPYPPSLHPAIIHPSQRSIKSQYFTLGHSFLLIFNFSYLICELSATQLWFRNIYSFVRSFISCSLLSLKPRERLDYTRIKYIYDLLEYPASCVFFCCHKFKYHGDSALRRGVLLPRVQIPGRQSNSKAFRCGGTSVMSSAVVIRILRTCEKGVNLV